MNLQYHIISGRYSFSCFTFYWHSIIQVTWSTFKTEIVSVGFSIAYYNSTKRCFYDFNAFPICNFLNSEHWVSKKSPISEALESEWSSCSLQNKHIFTCVHKQCTGVQHTATTNIHQRWCWNLYVNLITLIAVFWPIRAIVNNRLIYRN